MLDATAFVPLFEVTKKRSVHCNGHLRGQAAYKRAGWYDAYCMYPSMRYAHKSSAIDQALE